MDALSTLALRFIKVKPQQKNSKGQNTNKLFCDSLAQYEKIEHRNIKTESNELLTIASWPMILK